MVSRRLRELAGLPRVAIREEMAQATRQNGKWTDGEYTDGDSIIMNGLGWNIEFEPDSQSLAANRDTGQPVEGAWYAINDQGEEVDFAPGQEDRHDPQHNPTQKFPESSQINEFGEEDAVAKMIDAHRSNMERLHKQCSPGGELYRRIESIGGDTAYLKDVIAAADDLYRALDEADYGARGHLTQG